MSDTTPQTTPGPLLFGVTGAAFLLRLLHNQSILADPLYWSPLGGNLPLLVAAESIAQGDLVPFDGPISLNSPLYPYILAAVYKVFEVNAFYEARLLGALADATMCALVAGLAHRHFGRVAGWGAGLSLACYGPLIFFSVDLNPVPFTLLLLVGGVSVLDRVRSGPSLIWAGLLFGLAAATRPNVLVAGVLALFIPWLRGDRRAGRAAVTLAVGLIAGVAPVTALNFVASGKPVLMTTSAGHNLYIGHNPMAEPQYSLPTALDGDIFQSMKALAEESAGRPMEDAEVSGWYVRRAIEHAVRHPATEASLLARRSLLLFNDFEATTYANYDYQRWYSPVLRVAPTFSLLALLALPGLLLVRRRQYAHLYLPLVAGATSVLLFFYIARLRIVMIPTLGILAGATIARCVVLGRRKDFPALAVACVIGIAAWGVSSLGILESDTSNDWNKAGGLLTSIGHYEEAEEALERARSANPSNPNTYRNLAVLYRATERFDRAAESDSIAAQLSLTSPSRAEEYRRSLIELGR